jgi:hypothetical protein
MKMPLPIVRTCLPEVVILTAPLLIPFAPGCLYAMLKIAARCQRIPLQMHSITYRFGRLHASSVRCHWAVCTCMPGGRPCGRHPSRRQLPCQDSPALFQSASDLHWVRLPILNRYSKPAAVPATCSRWTWYSPRVHPWALAIYTNVSIFH